MVWTLLVQLVMPGGFLFLPIVLAVGLTSSLTITPTYSLPILTVSLAFLILPIHFSTTYPYLKPPGFFSFSSFSFVFFAGFAVLTPLVRIDFWMLLGFNSGCCGDLPGSWMLWLIVTITWWLLIPGNFAMDNLSLIDTPCCWINAAEAMSLSFAGLLDNGSLLILLLFILD